MMVSKKRAILLVLNMVAWASIFAFGSSCATSTAGNASDTSNRLLAENSAMKKRLPLLERENDILAKENGQHKIKIQDLEAVVHRLTADLEANKAQYTETLAARSEQIETLTNALQYLTQSSAEEIAALNGRMVAQEERFTQAQAKVAQERDQVIQERNKIIQQKNEMKTTLSAKLDATNQALQTADLEIEKLAAAKANLETSLGAKNRTLSELEVANKNLSAKLDETLAAVAELKKSRDASVAELKSTRATNASLLQKMAERTTATKATTATN